jgi:chitinase
MQQTYNLVSVYDPVAAVKWMAYDKNQWVSYDDEQTFKQKIDFANSLG